jgi:hypothetical protein
MQDEEKTIDVGEADEQAQEIDLDAPTPEQSLEEEQVNVEETKDQPVDAPAEPDEQSDVQKGELNEYSEGVNKRIAKLTRKMREAERQKEEAIAYAQSVQQQVDTQKKQYDQLGGQYTKELEGKVTAGMAAAKAAYKEAIDAGDIDKQVEAQQAIAHLSMENARLGQLKQKQEQKMQKASNPQENYAQMAQNMPNQQDISQAAQQIDPKAEDWASRNTWFGTDNAMTYTAFDIHRKLVEEEGFDPQTQEYYSEVDKRIRLEFPHKFDTVEQSAEAPSQAPVQNVASAKRPAAKGRRKTVKLTPSQVAISKRLGVPLEEYAKQLAAKEV